MKVIFLENVKGVGRKGEVKTVADGYFLNFLTPRKLAKIATDDAVKQAENRRQKEVLEKERVKEEVLMVKTKLESTLIELKGKANGQKLYASINTEDLIKVLVEKVKIRLDKANFPGGVHLKEIGEHQVEVKLAEGKKAILKVVIKADPS